MFATQAPSPPYAEVRRAQWKGREPPGKLELRFTVNCLLTVSIHICPTMLACLLAGRVQMAKDLLAGFAGAEADSASIHLAM